MQFIRHKDYVILQQHQRYDKMHKNPWCYFLFCNFIDMPLHIIVY